ncbi:hypothetical protein A2Z67_03725 [Candidatus Woesebacteria bacterium RBG_13_36_22]|uniref:Uncharacterized protein n=1 Tax=Candidatus Woesebacteria bacterium RBG_13_36_22 TaxID=1802478 RepID=A0A1F7WZA6_9BACT|nr:MAG: hypothetical protein A2Z67_03725 [Candidatus Woesebacteria bacterium RBG_13_36_22]
MFRIAKTIGRITKRPGLEKDPEAYRAYLKELDAYRKRMRWSRFHKVTPFADYLASSASRKKDFMDFVNTLEDFRCNVVGMHENTFYKIVSEFLLIPNGTKYYNPHHLFGCEGSYVAEEFRNRIFETLSQISSVTSVDDDIEEMIRLISDINDLGTRVDVKVALLGTKDWYCIRSILVRSKLKGWTRNELLGKIKVFYRSRIRKVYPEELLIDIARGELDSISYNSKKEKSKKVPKHIQAIRNQPWYKGWKENSKKDLEEGSLYERE